MRRGWILPAPVWIFHMEVSCLKTHLAALFHMALILAPYLWKTHGRLVVSSVVLVRLCCSKNYANNLYHALTCKKTKQHLWCRPVDSKRCYGWVDYLTSHRYLQSSSDGKDALWPVLPMKCTTFTRMDQGISHAADVQKQVLTCCFVGIMIPTCWQPPAVLMKNVAFYKDNNCWCSSMGYSLWWKYTLQ